MARAVRRAGDTSGPKGNVVWLCCQVHFHGDNSPYWPAYEKRRDVCCKCRGKTIAGCPGPIRCWSRI